MLRTFPGAVKQGCLYAAPFLALALLLWWSGADNLLAQSVYHPGMPWAVWLRKYGVWAGQLLLVFSFIALFVPRFGKKHPAFFHAALVTAITGIFAAGLLNQVVLQALVDRPRPRESVLLSTPPQTELRGQSFPSGHASIGFLLAVPAITLRSRNKKQNKSITYAIIIGTFYGLAMGLGRMVLGAHFASDVLFAGATVLGTAAFVTPLVAKVRTIPFWLIALTLFFGAAGMVLGNKFTLDLTVPQDIHWERLNLPCTSISTAYKAGIIQPVVNITLTGYGAPLSNLALYLDKKDKTVRLEKRFGIYHSLKCTGTVTLPE